MNWIRLLDFWNRNIVASTSELLGRIKTHVPRIKYKRTAAGSLGIPGSPNWIALRSVFITRWRECPSNWTSPYRVKRYKTWALALARGRGSEQIINNQTIGVLGRIWSDEKWVRKDEAKRFRTWEWNLEYPRNPRTGILELSRRNRHLTQDN